MRRHMSSSDAVTAAGSPIADHSQEIFLHAWKKKNMAPVFVASLVSIIVQDMFGEQINTGA